MVAEDICQAAKWVLAHWRQEQPFDTPMEGSDTNNLLDQLMDSISQDQDGINNEQKPPDGSKDYQDLADNIPPTDNSELQSA